MNAKNRKRKSVEKPLCKYGLSCYQRNPEHHKKFKHPPGLVQARDKKLPATDINENSLNGAPNDVKDVAKTPEKDDYASTESNDIPNQETSKNSNEFSLEETVRKILKSMPQDFFDFWSFCTSINKSNPEDAFLEFGYKLVGIYDLLARKLPDDKKVDISCHWRYFYDPPEFQTILKKNGCAYHVGYFRDNPNEKPTILASNSGVDGKLNLMGDNIFCAMNVELSKVIGAPKSKSIEEKAVKLKQDLMQFASKKKYSLDVNSTKTKERQKKVVAKTFHGLGIVVPVVNDIGYRPLPDSNAIINRVLKNIISAESDDKRLEQEEHLDELITNVNFANDECDYGMGLELALDLFCYGDPYFHNHILSLLCLAYNLLKRPKYASIVKAHLNNRQKGTDLSTLDV